MRPVRLSLKGFTAFRDAQELELEELDLFAVWGPTGSGKSSLLDAITYALYGRVERVGREVGQLVSQGQPRMAVTLEFEVDGKRYRVTRSTPARGATRVTLEREAGGEWVTYGEGADRVREVNLAVTRLVGLDYDAFTRSVLLPQGRFAEFLVGDPKQRRDILTELLGLELFRTMGARAGVIARDAKQNADARDAVIAREYAGVDPASVEAATATAKQTAAEAAAAAEAETAVAGLARRWEEERRRSVEVRACSVEVAEVAEGLQARAEELAGLVERAAGTTEAVAGARADVKRAEKSAAAAANARATAEERWGSLDDLIDRRGAVERLTTLVGDLARVEEHLAVAEERVAAASSSVTGAERDAEATREALGKAERAEREARDRHEEARHADLVASVTAGVKPGDPCPVCRRPLERLPETDSRALAQAAKVVDTAERARARAGDAASKAATAMEVVRAASASAAEEERRSRLEHERLSKDRAALDGRVADAFPDGVPANPLGELDRRIEELRATVSEERDADGGLRAAEAALRDAREAASGVEAETTAARAALDGAGLRQVLARVGRAIDDLEIPAILPARLPTKVGPLAEATRAGAGAARELSAALDERSEALGGTGETLLAQARRAIPERLEVSADDLPGLAEHVAKRAQELAGASRDAERTAEDLTGRLERRREMEEETKALREEHARYGTLATELRADRLIQFLQEEALAVLCLTGTRHLEYLSGGRYRLQFEGDEFSVVDVWNGEEQRSVRTLSGGETFLASLALALALSEEVQSLSVTERARLESLFLDEGFGTLDAETLDTVVGAIEQLRGDGRMVGVITHVWELAERMPVRIDVRKSLRGSRLEPVAG